MTARAMFPLQRGQTADALLVELHSVLGHGVSIGTAPVSSVHVGWHDSEGNAFCVVGNSLLEALSNAIRKLQGQAA